MTPMQKTAMILGITLVGSASAAAICFAVSDKPITSALATPHTASYPADGIRAVEISTEAADVNVEWTEGDTVEISLSSRNKEQLPDDATLATGVAANRLTIETHDESAAGFSLTRLFKDSPEPRLTVKMPRSMTNLDLVLVSIAGDVELPEMTLSAGRIATTSGDVNTSCLKSAGNFELSSISGDLRIDRCLEAKEIRISSTSGSVAIDGAKGTVTLETVSGDVNMEVEGLASIQTVSGDINLEIDPLEGETIGHSVSGDVKITLPRTTAAAFDLSSVSGELSADDTKSDSGKLAAGALDAKRRVKVETTSGDVNVTRL